MDLIAHLPNSLIFLDIEADNKWSLLETIIDNLCESEEFKKLGVGSDVIRDSIIRREKDMSTGLGHGAAFPHIRHPELDTMLLAMVVLKKPVPYDSLDGKPVNVVCMILAPEHEPTVALKVRSRLVKMLSNTDFRTSLATADSPDKVHSLIAEQGVDLDIPITAKDIMQPPTVTVGIKTPLKKVTSLMSHHHTNAVAVIDDNNKIVGEITCSHLFSFGMPDFFSEIKSVSFISEFDPFEKYFHAETHSVAGDILSTKFSRADINATLLELVFELTVLRHEKVYIEENGKLSGEVDQALVLDRIMRL